MGVSFLEIVSVNCYQQNFYRNFLTGLFHFISEISRFYFLETRKQSLFYSPSMMGFNPMLCFQRQGIGCRQSKAFAGNRSPSSLNSHP